MTNIDHIFQMIDKSNITLIGYTFKVERVKDEFISKLPCIKIDEIYPSFSIKSYLRDIKINQLLNGGNSHFKWFVIDLNDISNGSLDTRVIKRVPKDIQMEIKFDTPYKLIITSPVSKSGSIFNTLDVAIHMADLAFIIKESSIKLVKNRYSFSDLEISLDNLTNYEYICKNG